MQSTRFAEEIIIRFVRIRMNNVQRNYISDETRQTALLSQGFQIGEGLPLGKMRAWRILYYSFL